VKWSLLSTSCGDHQRDRALRWFAAAQHELLGANAPYAEGVLIVADSDIHIDEDLARVSKRPYVFVDLSAGVSLAFRCASAPPLAVVTANVATSAAHFASHNATIRTVASVDQPYLGMRPGVLVVGGPTTRADEVEVLAGAISTRRPLFVAGLPSEFLTVLSAGHSDTPAREISVGEGLVHTEVGLVVHLSGSPIVPDVALALGLPVASERAPLLAEWSVVPTIAERIVQGRAAPTLREAMGDAGLREWITEAGGFSVRRRFPIVSPLEAVQAVTEIFLQRQRMDALGVGHLAEYLDDAGLERLGAFVSETPGAHSR
jgi:hypothetical protein